MSNGTEDNSQTRKSGSKSRRWHFILADYTSEKTSASNVIVFIEIDVVSLMKKTILSRILASEIHFLSLKTTSVYPAKRSQ